MSATKRVGTACAVLRSGGIAAVTDDPGREDEVGLIMAAEHATPQNVAYFLGHTSGYLCASMSEERAKALQLHPMRGGQGDHQGTAFLVRSTPDNLRHLTTQRDRMGHMRDSLSRLHAEGA